MQITDRKTMKKIWAEGASVAADKDVCHEHGDAVSFTPKNQPHILLSFAAFCFFLLLHKECTITISTAVAMTNTIDFVF